MELAVKNQLQKEPNLWINKALTVLFVLVILGWASIGINFSGVKEGGIDIAKRIRNVDWDSEIIFITSHDSMFEHVHRNLLEVFEFIEKFQDFEKRLKRDLKIIYNKKVDKKILKVIGKKVNVELYMKNITYIMREKEDRKVVIHTNNDVEFRVNSTLAEIKEQLDSRFVQTHKSCIINKDYIVSKNYSKGYVDLSTGLRLFCLSRNFKDEVER